MRELPFNTSDQISLSDLKRGFDLMSKVSDIQGEEVIHSSSNITLPSPIESTFLAKITEKDTSSTPTKYSYQRILPQTPSEYFSNTDQLSGSPTSLPAIFVNESLTNIQLSIGQVVECYIVPHLDYVIVLNSINNVGQGSGNIVEAVTNLCTTTSTKDFIVVNDEDEEVSESITFLTHFEVEKTNGIVASYTAIPKGCETNPNDCCGEEDPGDPCPVDALMCCAEDSNNYSSILTLEFSNGTGCLASLNGLTISLHYSESSFGGTTTSRTWSICPEVQDQGPPSGVQCLGGFPSTACYTNFLCPGSFMCIYFTLSCSGDYLTWSLTIQNGASLDSFTFTGSILCSSITHPFLFTSSYPGSSSRNLVFANCDFESQCGGTLDSSTVDISVYETPCA